MTITHRPRRSLGRGNPVVPCRWQATGDQCVTAEIYIEQPAPEVPEDVITTAPRRRGRTLPSCVRSVSDPGVGPAGGGPWHDHLAYVSPGQSGGRGIRTHEEREAPNGFKTAAGHPGQFSAPRTGLCRSRPRRSEASLSACRRECVPLDPWPSVGMVLA
jgi:hypothetical protein